MADHKLSPPTPSTKMMLAFIIRQCEVDLGHPPTAAELAEWANNGGRSGKQVFLFGRRISEAEARIILGRPARLVSAKASSDTPAEPIVDRPAGDNVVVFKTIRDRLSQRPANAIRRRPRPHSRRK